MERIIKADVRGMEELTFFWGQYFPEIPKCMHPECECVATEVDAFFPYLDDLNRCESHPLEIMNGLMMGASSSGQPRRRRSFSRSGADNRIRRVGRLTWRPPR